jgi:hypothetical protein
MTWNTDINTDGLERVERPMPRPLPPIDLQPSRSPFYISQVPTTAFVNPDAIRNFHAPQLPSYRITPPQPLAIAGSSTNATPTVSTVAFNILQPPAPTIAQALSSNHVGYQFSFFQVRLPLGSTMAISTYKVYRNTTSANTTAKVIDTITHNPANVGTPIVIQDAQPNGVTQFYWVSAVSTAGVESTLTPAQSGTVSNTSALNSNSQLASSFHNNPADVTFSPTSTSVLSNDGLTFVTVVAASSNVFSAGLVSYNSGTVAISSFGTWFVYADDPLFQGGAVIYQSTSNAPFQQAGAPGRLPFGKITTVSGSTKTGGGYTGGTTGSGAGGGRGYVQG